MPVSPGAQATCFHVLQAASFSGGMRLLLVLDRLFRTNVINARATMRPTTIVIMT